MFALRFVGTLNPSFLSGLPLSRPIVRVSSTIVLKLCRRIRKRLASFVSIVMLVVSYLRKLEDLVSLIASQVSAFRRCFFSLSLSSIFHEISDSRFVDRRFARISLKGATPSSFGDSWNRTGNSIDHLQFDTRNIDLRSEWCTVDEFPSIFHRNWMRGVA